MWSRFIVDHVAYKIQKDDLILNHKNINIGELISILWRIDVFDFLLTSSKVVS
jgi:hypothetical protein